MYPIFFFENFFSILFLTSIGWIILLLLLCKRLKENHLNVYIQMHSPTLFKGDLKGFKSIFIFVFNRQHKSLRDPFLSSLSDAMLICFLLAILLLLAIFFMDGLNHAKLIKSPSK